MPAVTEVWRPQSPHSSSTPRTGQRPAATARAAKTLRPAKPEQVVTARILSRERWSNSLKLRGNSSMAHHTTCWGNLSQADIHLSLIWRLRRFHDSLLKTPTQVRWKHVSLCEQQLANSPKIDGWSDKVARVATMLGGVEASSGPARPTQRRTTQPATKPRRHAGRPNRLRTQLFCAWPCRTARSSPRGHGVGPVAISGRPIAL